MGNEITHNLEYQAAKTRTGASYTDSKLKRLELPPLAGKRFLDLGCNTGFYCRLAHEQGAQLVVGVDNSKRVIEKARSDSPRDVIYRDTGWDDFPHGTFDVVTLLSAIHYAKRPESLVRNIRFSLADEGLLILEGGMLFMDEESSTDMPLPGWRSVGDRCLHLTHGFIRNHLLCDFDWMVRGESEMRGGDDVPRYVIHAHPAASEKGTGVFTIDVLDFFAAAKQSANTIVEKQPAFVYVAPLKENNPDADYVSRALSNNQIFNLFQADLDFCLNAIKPTVVRLLDTLSPEVMARIETVIARHTKVDRIR